MPRQAEKVADAVEDWLPERALLQVLGAHEEEPPCAQTRSDRRFAQQGGPAVVLQTFCLWW